MDLKGSLIDTNLKIYPSEKLQNFLQTLPVGEDVPANILQLVKVKDCEKNKGKINEVVKHVSIHLSTNDLEKLKLIKSVLNKTEKCKPIVKEEFPEKDSVEKGNLKEDPSDPDSTDNVKSQRRGPYLSTFDIDWLYTHLQKRRENGDKNVPYLHVLLEGVHIEMPDNQVIKRNPDLEARCVKLRAQQEAREYRKMTKGVDNVRMRFPEDSISYQLKQMNRQLIAIGQFIISIFAGFLFGFKGVEWMTGPMDFGVKLLLGVMCALIIALAEIYFLAKKLNEELSVPETVQLGGPPKFVDDTKYSQGTKNNAVKKEHVD